MKTETGIKRINQVQSVQDSFVTFEPQYKNPCMKLLFASQRTLLLFCLLSLSLAAMGQSDPSGPSYDPSHIYVSECVYLNKEDTKYVDNVTYLDGFGRTLQETCVKA